MGTPSKNIESRAEGRPPEEAGSDDPEPQAAAILEESEERLEESSKTSVGRDETRDRAPPMGSPLKSG
jgi:hypothetical protein